MKELYKIDSEKALLSIQKRARSHSTTGIKGISKKGTEFIVRVSLSNGERKYLGCFKTIEEAKEVLSNFIEA